MQLGARYLDARVDYESSTDKNGYHFYTYHQVMGGPISVMLQEVASFLSNKRKELIILEFGEMDTTVPFANRLKNFIKMLKEELGDLIYKRSDDQRLGDKKLSEIVSNGPKVIILIDNESLWKNSHKPSSERGSIGITDSDFELLWFKNDEYSDAYYDDDGDKEAMEKYLQKAVDDYQNTPPMFKLQWLKPWKPGMTETSLYNVEEGVNDMLSDFLNQNQNKRLNVLFVDFFTESYAFEGAKQINQDLILKLGGNGTVTINSVKQLSN
ncbi:MAG: hypothetical protein R3B93_21905 [Bacteroidia bacterium]